MLKGRVQGAADTQFDLEEEVGSAPVQFTRVSALGVQAICGEGDTLQATLASNSA